MFMRKAVIGASIVLCSIAFPAAAQLSISIGVAPPAPRYEMVPAPREGYAWAPGYWRWEGERHVWAPGQWQEDRRDSHWVADRWVEKDGRHNFEAGRWERNERR